MKLKAQQVSIIRGVLSEQLSYSAPRRYARLNVRVPGHTCSELCIEIPHYS